MTRDDIIRMADEADDLADKRLQMKGEYHPDWHTVRDEIFAQLVATAEREACAKVADEWVRAYPHPSEVIAKTIRARSQQ